MSAMRVAIVDPNDSTRDMIRTAMAGVESVWLEAECARYEFFLDIVRQSNPDVALVMLDGEPEKAITLIQALSSKHPNVEIIATSSRNDSNFILQAFRGGAKEFLAFPIQYDEMLNAFERIRVTREGKGLETQATCRVFAFTGARGGAGTTSLAVNFGAILARNPANNVALVDLDLALGDAEVCLDIVPEFTLFDVATSIDRIDLQFLRRSLSKHSSGLYLLPHPDDLRQGHSIEGEHVQRVINLMKMSFTHVIIDCSKGYLQTDFAALAMADDIIMVTQLDISSVRNVVRVLMCLSEHEGMRERVKIIANRVGSSDTEIPAQRAEETIGKPVLCKIPNDTRTMMTSRNSGVPVEDIAPKSKLFQSLEQMAEIIEGKSVADKPKEKRSFFSFGK